MITALKGGEWTIDEIGGILETLFEKQYILTETVTTETRYRTETHIGYYTDENGNLQSYEYEVEVPYTYYICHVELENFNLSHVPVHIMSHDQLSMYAVYMSVLGNRPDLFPGSPYVNRYYHTQYEKYEIPPEALADEQFAAIIKEAEKYLGYPYIWGGSSPDTSFDCPASFRMSTTTAACIGASAGWARRGCGACAPMFLRRAPVLATLFSLKRPTTPQARPMWASMWAITGCSTAATPFTTLPSTRATGEAIFSSLADYLNNNHINAKRRML